MLGEIIEIFDLDGTLTKRGYSLWNLVTRELVVNPDYFDQVASSWDVMVKNPTAMHKHNFLLALQHTDVFNSREEKWRDLISLAMEGNKIQSSLAMTEIGIGMLRDDVRNPMALMQIAKRITQAFPTGVIIEDAIKYLKYRLEEGVMCVISTASYEEGAQGFVAGLVERGLIAEGLAQNIRYSGTQIDWQTFKVLHMNADNNKLFGLTQMFSLELKARISLHTIKPKIHAIFADDPAINDRALLQGVCPYCFVIKNDKNIHMPLSPESVLASWDDIYANRDNLEEHHRALKRLIDKNCKM